MIGAALLALAPVVLLIALGFAMRSRGFLPDGFWPHAERLSYFVLLPALFVHGLATADLSGVPVAGLGLVLAGTALASGLALVALRPLLPVDGPAFTSIVQGGIRFNNYVGITMAAGLFGAQGVALAAVANAVIVPTVNVFCVLVFARYGTARPTTGGVLRQLATNPLIVACAIGAALQAGGLGLPPGLEGALRALGQASLPLGLLCVGAALDFRSARAWTGPIAVASLVKFGLMPGLTFAACRLMGLDGAAAAVALIFHTLPTASSSYILARQLGGDAPLMAGITAIQTVLAAAALPLALAAATAALGR
ncbi:MAG TPA: AEC family transporter [Salinarimonas sp.]|nr:AEC family transporter [Salinarimonas sp.]